MLARNKNVLWTELDGQVAILDVDGGHYYEANKLGSFIWHLLENPLGVSDIVTKIISHFRVDRANCESDVNHFLGVLGDLGLIVHTQSADSE